MTVLLLACAASFPGTMLNLSRHYKGLKFRICVDSTLRQYRLRGAIYAIFTSILGAMNTMSNTITTLNSTTATTQYNIQLAANSIANCSTIISGVDANLPTTFNTIAPYLKYLRVIFLVYYGTVMGMSIIALVGVIMLAFLYKP
jgi:hypothetical protein